jgi:ATP-dependent DNA ligase
MEATTAARIPKGAGWQYEPKWDGFRCLIFRDGPEIELQSKAGQPLGRYFPDLVAAFLTLEAQQYVLDGEILIPAGRGYSFDNLLQRIHPAESRVRKLSHETPAAFTAFDLLADEHGRDLTNLPLSERRQQLLQFHQAHSALDGVVAKKLDRPYLSGDRRGMVKVKKLRTLNCVVGGFRYLAAEPLVGSLLLGLYDEQGLLHHIGFTSSMKREDRPALTKRLQALEKPPGFTGKAPGGPSRWSTEKSTEWTPLDPQLVVEVQYDHVTGGRLRHGAKFLRWRPDKAPQQCTMDQIPR